MNGVTMVAEVPKPPLAIFSPFPPSRSGIADYAAEQAEALARHWTVTAIIADEAPQPILPAGIAWARLSDWRDDPHRDQATPRLYHMGNNRAHAFIWHELCRRPGVTILHDQCLHHLLATLTVDQGDFAGYEQLLVEELGEAGRALAALRRYPVDSAILPFLLPLNGSVARASSGIVVHSAAAARRLAEDWPDLPVAIIPHHYSPPAHPCDKAEARRRLGLAEDRRIIVSMGFVTPPKQVPLVIRALARLGDRLPPFDYWLVGEAADNSTLDLAAELGLAGRVHLAGYVDLDRFQDYLAAADVVVNLRYPSAGETSGSLLRALGLGCCTMLFDYGSFSDVPDSCAVKLPLNTQDVEAVAEALLDVLNDTNRRETMGAQARAHVTAHNDLTICASALGDFIKTCQLPPVGPTGETAFSTEKATTYVAALIAALPEGEPRNYAEVHSNRVVQTLLRVPRGNGAALELGTHHVSLLPALAAAGFTRLAGSDRAPGWPSGQAQPVRLWDGHDYPVFAFDAEREPFPFADSSLDLVVCCEVLEHMSGDPMALMTEINRVLRRGGMLLLTTPNIASAKALHGILHGHWPYFYPQFARDGSTDRHNLEYSPHEIRATLGAAGFEVARLETEDSWSPQPEAVTDLLRLHGYSQNLRGDLILATAIKRTPFVQRFPALLYTGGDNVLSLPAASTDRA